MEHVSNLSQGAMTWRDCTRRHFLTTILGAGLVCATSTLCLGAEQGHVDEPHNDTHKDSHGDASYGHGDHSDAHHDFGDMQEYVDVHGDHGDGATGEHEDFHGDHYDVGPPHFDHWDAPDPHWDWNGHVDWHQDQFPFHNDDSSG